MHDVLPGSNPSKPQGRPPCRAPCTAWALKLVHTGTSAPPQMECAFGPVTLQHLLSHTSGLAPSASANGGPGPGSGAGEPRRTSQPLLQPPSGGATAAMEVLQEPSRMAAAAAPGAQVNGAGGAGGDARRHGHAYLLKTRLHTRAVGMVFGYVCVLAPRASITHWTRPRVCSQAVVAA